MLCLGEEPSTEKPGDIEDLTLPAAQLELAEALMATGKPVVAVLVTNRPRIVSRIADQLPAILTAYLPGDEGGKAVASIIYGDENPSGKLPFTYPRSTGSIVFYDHKYTETLDTKFGHNAFNPQWEFGHGLSYTTFAYADLKVDKSSYGQKETINISVTVKNTGSRAGKEVVQLYIRDDFSSITPSVKRLRALSPRLSYRNVSVMIRMMFFIGPPCAVLVPARRERVTIAAPGPPRNRPRFRLRQCA